MADRTVNINIKYNIATADVDRARSASIAAQAATDNLRQAASKAGSSGGTAFKPFIGSIETLTAKVLSLKDRITQSSDPTAVQKLSTEYKNLKTQLDALNKSLLGTNAATKQTAESTKSLSANFSNLVTGVKLLLTGGLVKEFIQTSIEAAALSGKVEGLERAFNRAFPNGILILDDLRKATHGTVVDFELMQRTLQATNLGVSVEKLPVLFEFAAARAQQTGESVDYLVDSIVRGIGRKSVLVLDNLGLSATRLKEQFHGAALQSQSVADVTTAVANIAKQELEKMGGYIETNATRVDNLKASWTQLGVEVSKRISGEGGLISLFKDYTKAFETLVEAQNKGITVSQLFKQRAIDEAAITGVNIIKQNEFTGAKEHDLQVTKEVIAEKIHDLILLQNQTKSLNDNLNVAKQATNASIFDTKTRIDNIKTKQNEINANKNSRDVLIEQIKILKALELELSKKDTVDKENTDTLKILESRVKSLNEQLEDTDHISTNGGVSEARRIKDQINSTQDKIDQIKHQIFLEEELQKRREGIKPQKLEDIKTNKEITSFGVQVNFDKDKIQKDFVSTTSQVLKDGSIILSKEFEQGLGIVLPAPIIHEDGWDKLKDSFTKHISDITNAGFDIINNLAQASFMTDVNMFNDRINITQKYYENAINLAGNNEKAKDRLRSDETKKLAQLQIRRAEAEKRAALGGIIVNTALGIIKAIATSVTIYDGLVEAAIVAGEGASQYAIARNARYYAKGALNIQGPGTKTSDSIQANLSVGESIMTADETKRSFGILKAIRNNKIDDRILKNIDFSGGRQSFDDERIVQVLGKIEQKKAPDIIKHGRQIYEVFQEKENFKKFIRSKSM